MTTNELNTNDPRSYRPHLRMLGEASYRAYCDNSGGLNYRGAAALRHVLAPTIRAIDELGAGHLEAVADSLGVARPASIDDSEVLDAFRAEIKREAACPAWDDLPPVIRAHWCAAASAVLEEHAGTDEELEASMDSVFARSTPLAMIDQARDKLARSRVEVAPHTASARGMGCARALAVAATKLDEALMWAREAFDPSL